MKMCQQKPGGECGAAEKRIGQSDERVHESNCWLQMSTVMFRARAIQSLNTQGGPEKDRLAAARRRLRTCDAPLCRSQRVNRTIWTISRAPNTGRKVPSKVGILGYCNLSGEVIVGQRQAFFQGGNAKKLPEFEKIGWPRDKLWKSRRDLAANGGGGRRRGTRKQDAAWK